MSDKEYQEHIDRIADSLIRDPSTIERFGSTLHDFGKTNDALMAVAHKACVMYRERAEARADCDKLRDTIAQCKEAGFIDAEGRVCRVIGNLVKTKDGVIVGAGAVVYADPVEWDEATPSEDISIRSTDGPLNSMAQAFFSDGSGEDGWHEWIDIATCYSSKEAAEACHRKDEEKA